MDSLQIHCGAGRGPVMGGLTMELPVDKGDLSPAIHAA
jgi:hypothetical protein